MVGKDVELEKAMNKFETIYKIDNMEIVDTKINCISMHDNTCFYELEDFMDAYTNEWLFTTYEEARDVLIKKCEETIKKYKGE